MKKLITSLVLASAFVIAPSSEGSVTYAIKTSGFGNSTTASVNNLVWGLVVNSASASFAGSTVSALAVALEGYSIPAIASTSTPSQIGTSDFYFVRSQTDSSSSGPPSFTDGFFNNVKFDLSSPVGTGDAAGLLWFAEGTTNSGDHFGFQDIGSVLPGDGSDITSGFTATGALASNVIGIPEPSRAVLAGLGLMGLFFRRRR
jgi:hypothetical protein